MSVVKPVSANPVALGDAERRRRWLAVIVLCAAQVMIILDQNIVNVALPAIRTDLHFSAANLVWTVNAYVIPFGGLLLLAGRLGDLLSRKYVFLAGLALFTLASAWCGFADSQSALLVARFVQGVGGAVTSAGLLGMVVTIFADAASRAKALGAFGFAAAGGGAAGTVAGGVLTDMLSWQWVFWINIPLGIAVGVLAVRLLPADRGIGWRAGADVLGAVLVTSGVMLAVYTLVGTESRGWTSPVTVGLGGAAVLGLLAFGVRQATAAQPLLPSRVLRSRNVLGANLIQALMVAALFGFMFYTVLYLQEVLGFTPLAAGSAFLPVPIVIAVVSMALVPRLLIRFGPAVLIRVGLPLLAFGLWLLSLVPVDGDYSTDLLPSMIIMPLGFGITMPSLMSLAMSDVAESDSGVTSGLFNTTQQVGGAVGLAVIATAVAARTATGEATGMAATAALTAGYRFGFTLAAAFVALAWLLALTVLRGRSRPAAAADAARPEQPA